MANVESSKEFLSVLLLFHTIAEHVTGVKQGVGERSSDASQR